MLVQQNIADPNVIMTFYGKAAKQILTTGVPGSKEAPYGVWSGTAEGRCHLVVTLHRIMLVFPIHWIVELCSVYALPSTCFTAPMILLLRGRSYSSASPYARPRLTIDCCLRIMGKALL
jgi:hypothetical protein